MRKRGIPAVVLAAVLMFGRVASVNGAGSCALAEPEGPVILTVAGEITCSNAEGEARFDRAMLEARGMQRLTTSTHWHDEPVTFEGPLVRDVLQAAGAQGTTVEARALNDYAVEIPASDFETYDVLLALKLNDEYMHVRDKGPIWIVYPRDQNPEIANSTYRDRWIWQLRNLFVR